MNYKQYDASAKSFGKRPTLFAEGLVILLLSGISAVACESESRHVNSDSETKEIIEGDDRKTEQDGRLRSLIGELQLPSSVCTAFVSGPQEITTALHCIPNDESFPSAESFKNIVFVTASGASTQIAAAKVVNPKKDYLVLTTTTAFSDYLEQGEAKTQNIKLIGYDRTQSQSELFSSDCRIEQRIAGAGAFSHSCDTISGMSGSPMLEGNIVVGLHLGYQEKIDRNAALDLSQLADDPTDVRVLGISNEFGVHFRCREAICKAGPVKIPGLNPQWSGFIIGGPVGALINDHLAAQQKIDEMRRAGAQREADLLALKIQLDSYARDNKAKTDQLACESAKAGFLPALEALYNSFKVNIAACADDASCNNAWSSYKNASEAIYGSANGQCK